MLGIFQSREAHPTSGAQNPSVSDTKLVGGPAVLVQKSVTDDRSDRKTQAVDIDVKKVFEGIRLPRPLPAKLRAAKGKNGNGSWPPSIQIAGMVRRQTLRFETTNAVSGTNGIITADDIFGALGVIGKVSNTSVVALATSFRLRRVTIYPSASTSGGVVASISWASDDDHDPDRRVTTYRPAGVVGTPNSFSSVPPKNSTAGFWMRNSVAVANVAMFYVDISGTGSILDLELDWTLTTDELAAQTITVATATVGKFYRLYLNRVAAANTLKPVEFSSTT